MSPEPLHHWLPQHEVDPQWRGDLDAVVIDVLELSRRRLFVSAAKRLGEVRRSLERHEMKCPHTLDELADAVNNWDPHRSVELAGRLRLELGEPH